MEKKDCCNPPQKRNASQNGLTLWQGVEGRDPPRPGQSFDNISARKVGSQQIVKVSRGLPAFE